MKKMKKWMGAVLMAVMLMMTMITPVSAATRAEFGRNSCCTVRISQSLLNKRGKQYATVKLKTHSGFNTGWNSGGKVMVTMKDEYGRLIWRGVKRGGDTLKLGDDHRIYRIYVSAYDEPVTGWIIRQTIIGGNNFTNRGKCVYWSFSNQKNCSIQ